MLIVLDDRKTALTSILINQEERYHLDDERQIISNVIISENCVGIPNFSVNCFKNDRLQTFQKFHIDILISAFSTLYAFCIGLKLMNQS